MHVRIMRIDYAAGHPKKRKIRMIGVFLFPTEVGKIYSAWGKFPHSEVGGLENFSPFRSGTGARFFSLY